MLHIHVEVVGHVRTEYTAILIVFSSFLDKDCSTHFGEKGFIPHQIPIAFLIGSDADVLLFGVWL